MTTEKTYARDIARRRAVTIGEMVDGLCEELDSRLETLCDLVRKNGYQQRHVAEKYLNESIGELLCDIDNLHCKAGSHLFRQDAKKPSGMAID